MARDLQAEARWIELVEMVFERWLNAECLAARYMADTGQQVQLEEEQGKRHGRLLVSLTKA